MAKAEKFSAKALQFRDILADPTDKRSIQAKAEASGFSKRHGYRLSARADFAELVARRAREMLPRHLGQIYAHLREDAVDETLPPVDRHRASKLLLQVAGELRPERPEMEININQASVSYLSVPEKLQRHLDRRREMLRDVESTVSFGKLATPEDAQSEEQGTVRAISESVDDVVTEDVTAHLGEHEATE